MSQFSTLGLAAPIARAIEAKGYVSATPIQLKAIPAVLAGGDVLGIAATGTGKTAAFALPILHRLYSGEVKANRPGSCRALVLCPTRELAAQIAASFKAYGAHTGLRVHAIYGGASFDKQMKELGKGADIIVATPGRLLDHMERRTLTLTQVSMLVLDEADHMLDLGFIPAVRRIVKALPLDRQTLMFSATMPGAIRHLADELLATPTTISVSPSARPPDAIDQSVVFIDASAKRQHLANLLTQHVDRRSLVFTRTKRGADKVVKDLAAARLAAAAIHGNKSQNQRERALEAFRSAKTPVLVATDIAARGIDIGGIDLVINYDLPEVPETYVHRIGRTARAGNVGRAVSFCAEHERPLLKAIERSIGKPVPGSELQSRRTATSPRNAAEPLVRSKGQQR
ncbi:MAG: DEAD/DEAH box helicase [Alphaproteobacteria bacterium]